MTKELKDLDCGEEVKTKYGVCYAYSPDVVEEFKQALQRLESIDNAKPSEALKELKKFTDLYDTRYNRFYINVYETIEQALLKAQEQEKVLEIIKKKSLTNCNIALVKDSENYEVYCKQFYYFLNKYIESPNGFEITKEDLLTQEEFDLLKRNLKTLK